MFIQYLYRKKKSIQGKNGSISCLYDKYYDMYKYLFIDFMVKIIITYFQLSTIKICRSDMVISTPLTVYGYYKFITNGTCYNLV